MHDSGCLRDGHHRLRTKRDRRLTDLSPAKRSGMAYALLEIDAAGRPPNDRALIRRFRDDPEAAYADLLERFTPAILRMIRRFMHDSDEVMEVYTAICERLRAHSFRALRSFRANGELMPWLSVVAANACRDRLRERRAASVPQSVISKLDAFEQLVFNYYWRRVAHEDIAESISTNEGMPCTPLDVMRAIGKINDLLSVNKRWYLLVALNANRPTLSIEELREAGIFTAVHEPTDDVGEALRNRERVERLNWSLGQLDSEDRLLILLRYEHGMTASQIADVMQYDNHKYVYTRVRTVVARLRRSLGED